MAEYHLTTTEYGIYYASLPKGTGKRSRGPERKGVGQLRALINLRIRQGVELPGVLNIKKVGNSNLLKVQKKVHEAYVKLISPNGK